MIKKKNRAGTSQDDKFIAALQPEYVSVEERSTVDLLMYLRKYAENVKFYDEGQSASDNFWKLFLDFGDQEILELAEFAENPGVFSDDAKRLSKYSKPHLALLLTFLKLLQYPKEQFARLTEKNVDFFYKSVLKLTEQDEVPDQVHVIFNLARDVREYLLKKGTVLNAGKDDTGADLHYEVMEDVILNNAQVSDVKTIHFSKEVTNLKYIHKNCNRGDTGFEKMLCLVLGNLPNLPPYATASGRAIPVDAAYLRTELYWRINGKERDELESSDADYIFRVLCFRSLKEFKVCLNLLYREINHGYAGVSFPADSEWEEAYNILDGVHRERISRLRREQLKGLHKDYGFEGMMEYAFGEPNPGNMLYKMPAGIKALEDLANSPLEAARQYIENKLCMTVADFRAVFAKKDNALTSIAGDEVYTILESAWTTKRGYRYPEIGSEIISGFYADTIYDADEDEAVERFSAFGKSTNAQSTETVNLGFAVSSSLLHLCEGSREIEIVISCKEGGIDYDKISALLAKNQTLFTASLSVNGGWQEAPGLEFETGKFIIKPELKTYNREDSSLVCDITEFPFFDQRYVNAYIEFANGRVYQIKSVDESSREIRLQSVSLEHPGGSVRLIKRLKPKTFVAELKTALSIPCYSFSVQSIIETFEEYYQGKYLVDGDGKIFLITRFISATAIEVNYCGTIGGYTQGLFDEKDRLFLNKVWETVEVEYETNNSHDFSGLRISAIHSSKKNFTFTVSDAALKISYPEGATAQELIEAWEQWKDNPQNDPGRYTIKRNGSASAAISEISKELELTGEVVKRYESLVDNGIRVTYSGRPIDPANLNIQAPSATIDRAAFLVSGGTLTITPGRVSRTASQIAADWRLWLEDPDNDPKGFQVEGKDTSLWQAVPVSEMELAVLDKQIKKCEICNLDGVGIRVWYTGPVADRPKLVLQENNIDLFDFVRSQDQVLTIKYPSQSATSAYDLVEAWEEWVASEISDPGNFSLEMMGDGLWNIQARTEKELQASENQIIECTCTLKDKGETPVGIIARYKISGEYGNAIIAFIKHKPNDEHPKEFGFSFSEIFDESHDYAKTKVLTVAYPPLDETVPPDILQEYQERHLQTLLAKWNREYHKQGFSLVRTENGKWPLKFPDSLRINFMESLNYISTIDPDGFIVKYRPKALPKDSPFKEKPLAKVVIQENDPGSASNAFAFHLSNDYPNNLKILFIKYPTDKKQRTVDGLDTAWKARKAAAPEGEEDKLGEFDLVPSGTKKWEITGITSIGLNTEVATGTWITDPIRQKFFEYKTSDVNGFTLYYTGPEGTYPRVTMEEHELDNFGFELQFERDEYYDVYIGEKLKINYPKRVDKRLIGDLLTAWHDYQNSFQDGGATLRSHTKQELQSLENGVIECTIAEAGIIARYKPSDEYPGAIVKFAANSDPNATKFSLAFSDVNDPEHDQLRTKVLTITYPPLPVCKDPLADLENQMRHVQALIALWEQEEEKFGFSLSPKDESAKWTRDFKITNINFRDDFNYICRLEPDGYVVKYKPDGFVAPFTRKPQADVVSYQNTGDAFAFQLLNDYSNNRKLLIIKYPTIKKHRTVGELLKAWTNQTGSLLEVGSIYWQKDGELREFEITPGEKTTRLLGFEIVDTSPAVVKRAKSELLTSGDRVREYHTENGICISYTGHRSDPMAVLEPIEDFNDTMIGQMILWENGEVFTVTGRRNRNQVIVGSLTQNIPAYKAIKLYTADAICFDALKFTLRLNADFPAVVPQDGTSFSSDPAIKVMLKRAVSTEQRDSVADFYDCFKTIDIRRIDLKVTVQGLQDLKMRGNIAMINPANPFLPFGQTPDESARFYFANPEICEKKLDWLLLNLNWAENQFLTAAGLPDMEQYYYAYSHSGLKTLGTIKNEDFEVKLQFLDQRAWVPVSTAPQVLFSKTWQYNDFSRQTYQGALFEVNQVLPKDPLDWPRYYELDLFNQGFLKDFYPELVSTSGQASRNLETVLNDYDAVKKEIKSYEDQIKAAKLAEAEARENGVSYYLPVIPEARDLPTLPENDLDIGNMTLNPPYTPVIQSLSIDYAASAVSMLNRTTGNADANGIPVRLFRFNPFGYEEMGRVDDEDDFLLPQYDQEGYLMIGLKNLEPLQSVSLLFQMVSGSGDASLGTPDITWSYLADNQWFPFKQSEILKDRTFGLQDTGIIRFGIPMAATTGNTILPGNRCWIRAEAPENITAIPDILDIRARAVRLTYLNRGNDPEHLAKPLAAESINDMTVRESAVQEVIQPYSSFNGKHAETSKQFYTRVSERLKHKNRALTLDDYEKLILTQFPQLYKVKCVPQKELDLFEPSSQGEVVVIVILKNSNATPFFPLKPKTPANVLGEIKNYIQTLMPPQVKVTVRNPRFEEVRYRLAVKFVDDYDRGFYINKIIDDLKRYLSPWAYDQEAAINFGSSVYCSSIINYLENQAYVDYVANFNPLQQLINHETYTEVIPLFLTDDNEVSAKYPDSILVSADSHMIDVITTEFFDPGAFRGIGYMKIGTDFWIDRPGAIFSVGLGQMEIEARPVMRHALSDIPVKVIATAVISGQEYPAVEFFTRFSLADSQQIWEILCVAGYLDKQGNVITDQDLYVADFHLLGSAGKFAEYLTANLPGFSFQIKASDFGTKIGNQDEFSYKVEKIYTQGLETAVVNIIKAGLGFDGSSQYPFVIY
jgi:hypothetical protein